MCSITGVGERLHKVLEQFGSKLWFPRQQKASIDLQHVPINCAPFCIVLEYFYIFANLNIYIFIAITLDETSIPVAVHFSMKNIYQSYDVGCAMGWSNIAVS